MIIMVIAAMFSIGAIVVNIVLKNSSAVLGYTLALVWITHSIIVSRALEDLKLERLLEKEYEKHTKKIGGE